MASIINLENLPELVLDKITSFLNHKQLVTLEQVSRKLKYAVDVHFSTTDHLIIGTLPKVVYRVDESKDKKCLDGLLNIIKRCGIRLRTIQIVVLTIGIDYLHCLWNYLKHIFASPEMSNNCPSVENIIASPNMDCDRYMLDKQNLLLHLLHTETYANNIKIYTGESCKLRGISLFHPMHHTDDEMDISYERVLNLYPNLEQISIKDYGRNFEKVLPQFIENGLKVLNILGKINLNDAQKYCNIGKTLRTLRLNLDVRADDDVAALNKLYLPKSVRLATTIIGQLNENVCNSISTCSIDPSIDCSLMTKLKNLEELISPNREQLKIIAGEPFPELKRIYLGIYHTYINSCDRMMWCHCSDCEGCEIRNPCVLQTYLIQILTNKGDQLTVIHLSCGNCVLVDVVLKALKHCKAAMNFLFDRLYIDSFLSVTAEDIKAVCHLPNMQRLCFSIMRAENDTSLLLRALMKTTVKEHLDFQFKYEYDSYLHIFECRHKQMYSLCRINF